ncbi:MAG: FecR domain-containing protein [Deltaproteobacteria bacterium]|nr:FecR domain-containing protein [Deltaproteobacteria bacterium]
MAVYSFLLMIFIILSSSPAGAPSIPAGKIERTNGEVTVKRAGIEDIFRAKEHDTFFVGDTLTTKADSFAEIVFVDGGFANIPRKTALMVNHYAYEKESRRRKAVVRVLEGTARFVLSQRPGKDSSFVVETDTARISAGLADFIVEAQKDKTELYALGGAVQASNTSIFIAGNVTLETNEASTILRDKPPAGPRSLTGREITGLTERTNLSFPGR